MEKMDKKDDSEIRNINVYDYRYLEKLYYIFPSNIYIGKNQKDKLFQKKAAVIVNLYYLDDANYYFERLLNVPEDIHLYIVSSDLELISRAKCYMEQHNRTNCDVIAKNNRGRDISALLVACKEYFFQYEYICFIHDKKSKCLSLKNETDLWIENMWGNLISSEAYIANVFEKFDGEKELGLLVPPEPIGMYQSTWYKGAWCKDYEMTENLAQKLQLSCKMDKNKPPITISTAFWCKTKSLRKLLSYDWKYEDFPNEPMAGDGTINHSIERIFAYVAQDAGYKTGIVMNDKYASLMFAFLQVNIQNTFKLMGYNEIMNFYDVDRALYLSEFCLNNKKVYLYGSGKIGRIVLARMRALGFKIDGFVISNKAEELGEVEGLPVVEFANIEDYSDMGIIISVGAKLKNAIEKILNNAGFFNYIYWKNDVE
jgi:rhamnosyltransferase